MIALNNKEGVKHKHIVTCETPCDFFEANVLFKKCRLNFNQLNKPNIKAMQEAINTVKKLREEIK